jgi:two-component system response regulator VicR
MVHLDIEGQKGSIKTRNPGLRPSTVARAAAPGVASEFRLSLWDAAHSTNYTFLSWHQPTIVHVREGWMAKKKIVYIEDHEDMIDLVRLILEPKGYEIIGAIGGREGIETVQREMPDLVLLDLMMPDMDGWEVHRRMKADEKLRAIPVIVVTAKDKPIDQVLGLHVAKVDAYLVKADFGPKELLDNVRQVLGEI